MSKIIINQTLVTAEVAKQMTKICPFNALEYNGKELSINAACKMCKLCVKKGVPGVCTIEEDVKKEINKDEWKGIGVYVEHSQGEIHPVVFELIGKARELAKVTNHEVFAILFCDDAKKYQDELLSYGIDKLYVYEDARLAHFNVELYRNAMVDFIDKVKPSVILYGGTSIGRSFAPRVAAHFKTGLTADCTILGMKENTDLIQNRPAFGGNIMASIVCPNNRPQMATVRYKIFKKPEKVTPFGKVVNMSTEGVSFKTSMTLKEVKEKDKSIDISEVDVLVAVGKAFKTEADLKMAYELASLLGGEVACTRPLVENGLMNPKKQIGLSGRTVSPKLLINLGISGAVQFTAGMGGSDLVFSINKDKNAPIFDVSHYGIVGDVFEILPKLIKEIKAFKGEE